jgi:molybdenum cofactor guanylyltransferase
MKVKFETYKVMLDLKEPEINKIQGLLGLVVCGGQSSRMGMDKSMLVYYEKPQRYHVYEMLLPFCEKVFLSVNKTQLPNVTSGFSNFSDLSEYENIGPMAALLTAFTHYPNKNFLIVGCDYPFISKNELNIFIKNISKKSVATAFYNADEKYEPLLAYYSSACGPLLRRSFEEKQYSLQYFLKSQNADKYTPEDARIVTSADTDAQALQAKILLNTNKLPN